MVLAELPEGKSLFTSPPQSDTSHLLVHMRPSSPQSELPELGQVVGDGEGDEGGEVAGHWPPRVNQLRSVKLHAFMFYLQLQFVSLILSFDIFLSHMSHSNIWESSMWGSNGIWCYPEVRMADCGVSLHSDGQCEVDGAYKCYIAVTLHENHSQTCQTHVGQG